MLLATITNHWCTNQQTYMKYVDVCKNYSCQNGGHCIEKNGAPKCKCPRGYHGDRCEQKCKKLSNKMECMYFNLFFTLVSSQCQY